MEGILAANLKTFWLVTTHLFGCVSSLFITFKFKPLFILQFLMQRSELFHEGRHLVSGSKKNPDKKSQAKIQKAVKTTMKHFLWFYFYNNLYMYYSLFPKSSKHQGSEQATLNSYSVHVERHFYLKEGSLFLVFNRTSKNFLERTQM